MADMHADRVVALIDGVYISAALGAAMELGLFWLLKAGPKTTLELASELEIPGKRCSYWLQLLCETSLLERQGDRYALSPEGHSAVLGSYSQESWAFLARETRERLPAVTDLPRLICEPGSVWEAQGRRSPDYVAALETSPSRARAFTRMLYEIHRPMAEAVADALDMSGVARMMDLGGGSGVMSMALLHRYPALAAVVVDIPNVCTAGSELARESNLEERLDYLAADFMRDELPTNFDLILQCDVGVFGTEFYRKLQRSLKAEGRLVVIDKFESKPGVAHETRRHWAFLSSLENPDHQGRNAAEIRYQLEEAGLTIRSHRTLPAGKSHRWSAGWTIMEAKKLEA